MSRHALRATITDIGVASRHRQAMIRTATALIKPNTQLVPTEPTPDKEGGNGDEHHHDHKFACHHIHALHRQVAGHWPPSEQSATAWYAPTFSARITRAPLVFIVAPITLSPRRLVTGTGSPVGFIDRTLPLQSNAVDPLLAGACQVTDVNMVQRYVFFVAIRIDPTPLGCQTEQRLDGRRRGTGLQLDDLPSMVSEMMTTAAS